MSTQKQKIIRRLRPIKRKLPMKIKVQTEVYLVEESVQTTNKIEEVSKVAEDDQDLSEYKFIPPLQVPIKQIPYLEPEQRERMRKSYTHLAEYIFMTQREKSKYFHEKNIQYNKTMCMPGSMPARKIQFKRNFQVKLFNKCEAPKQLKQVKSFKDKYHSKIHYSG